MLLLAASFVANLFEMGERGLAYLSSAVSFLAAFAVGMLALRRTHAPGLPAALLTATVLVIALLTVGFLVQGDEMNPSAVLSIVSFTYAGVLSGMLFRSPKKAAGRKHSFSN